MFRTRDVLSLSFFLIFLLSTSYGTSEVLLNGTSVYLSTGESYGLYQGYVLSLKSVSGSSVWFELAYNDKIVKSEIVNVEGYFIYNKSNSTVLAVKVDNVYAGSSELVKLLLYQFIDPDVPAPAEIETTPKKVQNPDDNNPAIRIHTPMEPLIWTIGIILVLILFYILRKFW